MNETVEEIIMADPGSAPQMPDSEDAQGSDSPVQSVDPALLAEAFRQFNEQTERLSVAHETLSRRLAEIDAELEERNRELAETNDQLETKIQELDEVRNFLGSVIDSMSSGLITIDIEGRITNFNGAAETITGHDEETILGKPLREVLSDGAGKLLMDTLREDRVAENVEILLTDREGVRKPIRGSTAVVRDSEGRCLGATLSFLDLSHLKTMEEKVRRNARLASLGELAAGVAHEMRNPLTTVRGFIQLLPHEAHDPEFLKDFESNILREIDRLAKLTDGLLDFAKPVGMELSPVKADTLFEEVLLYANERINKSGVEVVRELAEVEAPLDRDRIKQVLLNLVFNACDAMSRGGTLTVSVSRRESVPDRDGRRLPHLVFSVADEGAGMDESTRERLFDPFFTTKDHGTGLGLSVSNRIVEEHGGFMNVESEPGRGTTFEVLIPVESPAAAGGDS